MIQTGCHSPVLVGRGYLRGQLARQALRISTRYKKCPLEKLSGLLIQSWLQIIRKSWEQESLCRVQRH
jgi:hypothetical protein